MIRKRVRKAKKHAARAAAVYHTHHAAAEHARRKKHHKPFRVRHVGLLVIAFVVCMSSALQLGIMIGRTTQSPRFVDNTQTPGATTLQAVRSSEGFSFGFDNGIFSVEGTESTGSGARSVSEGELRQNRALISVTVKPVVTRVNPQDAATQLSFGVGSAVQSVPVSSSEFDVVTLSSAKEDVDGMEMTKRIYQHTPKVGSLKIKVYSVQWTGTLNKKPFTITLEGLVGGSEIPSAYTNIFDTLNLAGTGSVLGTSIEFPFVAKVSAEEKLEEKFMVDSLSPSVVKIYHIICGALMYEGQQATNEGCLMPTGTGFLISSEGHVATNGHVVVFDAEDFLILFLLSNPNILIGFLQEEVGLSAAQISQLSQRPDLLSAIIAKIYDLPDNTVEFKNENHTYLVSLGADPFEVKDQRDLTNARNFDETDSIKKAEFIAADYAAKDLHVINSGDPAGFSSSDVALLKFDGNNTPVVDLASGGATQGQKINIVGFPGDAENQLIDNTSLNVSVTNGTISSIRDAAGGRYKLFQSDADASQGNSGGPVFDESGQVLGLLTYRFKSAAAVDAAKSYIRDVEDLKKLLEKEEISLNTDSETQDTWEKGLRLFSENRFSKSLKEFEKVTDLYPAHRLANSYIGNAKQAIADGKDVKDFPILMLGIVLAVGAAGVAVAVVLIARHKGHHHAYQMAQAYGTPYGPLPPGGSPPPQPIAIQPPAPAVPSVPPAQPGLAIPAPPPPPNETPPQAPLVQ